MHAMLLAGFLFLAPGTSFTGTVVTVDDCRSLTVRSEDRKVVLRLHGIDCDTRPSERGQQAWQALRTTTLGQVVQVELQAREPGGRWRARVFLNGQDQSRRLVELGLAWWTTEPVDAEPPELPAFAPKEPAPRRIHRPREGLLHGNENSHVYHEPTCRYYDCMHCVVEFANEADARAAGYRPGGCCHRRE